MTSVMTRIAWHCLAVIGTLGWFSDAAAAAQSNLSLDRAARDGDVATVRSLLQQGADPNELNTWGTNALTGASTLGADSASHTQVVELLLANGADVNRRVLGGTTALNEAAYWGHLATVRVLLNAGADPNAEKENGYTPLLAAASRGHLEIVRVLLDAGANVDRRTKNGLTALHLASAGGFPGVVSLLEQAGADAAARSRSNETYEDVAGRTAELQRDIGQLEKGSSAAPVAPTVGRAPETGASDLMWWELLLSFVATWVIGLAPPLLIRYALVRGPMSRGAAVGTAALFYFGNIVLFTLLGSTNRSHAVLFLIAWLSYLILRRPMRESELRVTGTRLPEAISDPERSGEPPRSDRKDWWSKRQRLLVARAATAGCLVGVAVAALTYFDWRARVESAEESRRASLLADVAIASASDSSARPTNKYEAYLERSQSPARVRAPASEACHSVGQRLTSSATDEQLAQAALLCNVVIPPLVSTRLVDYPLQVGIMVGAVPTSAAISALCMTAVLWLLGWPHAGWRRLAIVVGPAAFLLALVLGTLTGFELAEPALWIGALVLGLCAPFALLALIVVSRWVRGGFV